LDFIMTQVVDHLRNLLRRETPARERLERTPSARRRRQSLRARPDLLERATEGTLFEPGISFGERCVDRLLRKAARSKLPLDPSGAVSVAAKTDRGARGAELVEPSLVGEPRECAGNGDPVESSRDELPSKLLSPARSNGQQSQGAFPRRLGGGGVAGRRFAADRPRPRL
jgi:hypothetical protein